MGLELLNFLKKRNILRSLYARSNCLKRLKHIIFPSALMRLGVAYNVFDGEELLLSSVRSIRKSAEYICVVYQVVSNRGEPCSDTLLLTLDRARSLGLIDECVLYVPNRSISAEQNERRKRELGMKKCKTRGCTHYLSMDVDEFYRSSEIERAKSYLLSHQIEVSAVSVVEYVKDPTFRLVSNYMFPPDQEDYLFFVPFICKIQRPDYSHDFPCFVDATRSVCRNGRFCLFRKDQIAMHHMSTIRLDLGKKFRNSTISLMKYPNSSQFIETQKRVLEYEYQDGRVAPKGYDFIGKYLVKRVDDEFSVRVHLGESKC